jgi:hypothetical protein
MFLEFRKRKTEPKENGNFYLFTANGKLERQISGGFATDGNGKRTSVFLGRQIINGNQRLLFQQTCQS